MGGDGDGPRWASVEGALREILAAQAATDARLSELFRAHAGTQADAKTGRELAARIEAVLQEQNVMLRLQELRTELRAEDAALRQDVVAANTHLRNELAGANLRIKALEDARTEGKGMVKVGQVAIEVVKVACAAGLGGLLVKMLGG